MHRQSLEINEQLGRREGMALAYGSLGSIYKARGDLDQARVLWNRARTLYMELGAQPMVDTIEGWLTAVRPD